MRIDRTGEKYITNEGYTIEIVKYYNNENSTIRFDNGVIINNNTYQNIKNGEIKNPLHKSLYEIGYLGQGEYRTKKDSNLTKVYNIWKKMLGRCYDEKTQEKAPTYKGCSVDERWHNFQVFAEWYEENYKPETMQGWQLDKDILFKGNNIYSPKTCCLVPHEINKLFIKSNSKRGEYPIGVIKHKDVFRARVNKSKKYEHVGLYSTPEEAFHAYKEVKEHYIKQKADEWKDLISEKVYEAIYKYQVEITD